MKYLFYKFADKINKDVNTLSFIYNDTNINEELTLFQLINIKDQNNKSMRIWVHEKNAINESDVNSAPTPYIENSKNEDDLKIKIDEMNKKNEINELRNKIDILNNYIKEIIRILNEVFDNFELYYKIKYNNIKNNKYYIDRNSTNNIIEDINTVINENNLNNRIKNILKIYNKINKNNINTNTNYNEITLRYKIENENKVKIFGDSFVNKNKNNVF